MTPITYAIILDKNNLNNVNKAGQSYYDMFLELAKEAESSSDKLNANYKDISNRWQKYECFTVVYEPMWPLTFGKQKYEAVAFSGLQADRFGGRIGRALTRTYYSKAVRKNNISPRKLPNLASKYMLPIQYDYAKRHDFDHIFISFESTLARKKFTTLFTNVLNKTYENQNWKELDGLYYTCKIDGNIKENCWQHIILSSFNDKPFNLYRKNYD